MAAKTSSPGSAFTKVLRSFETGGFTYRDVVAELKRLLKAGASPTELSEILRRREFVEPLPVEARKEVLGLLDAAKERTAAQAVDPPAESAGASSVPASKPAAGPDEIPAAHPPTVRIPTIVPNAARVEGVPKPTIRLAPAPRIPDPVPIPESKVVTIPVQIQVSRAARISSPAQSSSSEVIAPKRTAASGHDNVIARAITLARTSASPDSVQRKTRIAPTAKLVP